MIVYKYVKPERSEDLKTGLIRFTQADALNDPFEVNPCFSDFIQGGIDHATAIVKGYTPTKEEIEALAREQIQRFREKLFPNYLMLSLSKRNNNPLMWAHYAECHRGIVLGFDGNHQFFREPTPLITKLLSVEYSDKRYILPRMEDWTPQNTLPTFLRKSLDWDYEQEMRMFSSTRAAVDCRQDALGQFIYLFQLPRECIAEIIFGISTAESVKRTTSETINQLYPNIRVLQAKINATNFDLDLVPIPTASRTGHIHL